MNRLIRHRRLVASLATVAAVLLAGGGCQTVRGIVDTTNALQQAGYDDVSVGFGRVGGDDQLNVSVRPVSTEGGAEGQANQAAGIVWTTFPLRFDRLRLEVEGPVEQRTILLRYGEMAERFGPRDPSFDEDDLGAEIGRTVAIVVGAMVVGGVVFLGLGAVVVVLLVRAHRRRAAIDKPPWPPPSVATA